MLIRLSDRIPLARINPASFRFYVAGTCAFWLLFYCVEFGFPQLPVRDEIEMVLLPDAGFATPDDEMEPQYLVIWVLKNGAIIISGFEPSDEEIRDILLSEARLSRARDGFSEREVLIKADERTPFKHVLKIINWCRDPEVRIYRLSFGIRPEP